MCIAALLEITSPLFQETFYQHLVGVISKANDRTLISRLPLEFDAVVQSQKAVRYDNFSSTPATATIQLPQHYALSRQPAQEH